MNKKLISLLTMTAIMFTSVSPVFAKNFASKENVELTHAWNVKFNKTLGSNQDFSKVTVKDSNGNVIPVSVIVNSDKQSVTVTPKSNYNSNTNYTLTVDGIKDSNGKALSDNATMQFTTVSDSTDPSNPSQPTNSVDVILPQAVTFNSDGSVTPLTTNEYVNKAYPGKGYGWSTYIPNPDYDKNYGLKHVYSADHVSPIFIDNNNELAYAASPYDDPLTYSAGFQYNKYMKDQMRELYRGFIGTTPYDGSHYFDLYEDKELDNTNDSIAIDYREVTSDDNRMNFSYYFPIKPIKKVTDEKLLKDELLSETWKHVKDNANLVLEIYDTNILYDKSVSASNFKQSLYACFGINYADKILNFMEQEDKKARSNLNGSWDGSDSITINNITIYTDDHGFTYSFFLK